MKTNTAMLLASLILGLVLGSGCSSKKPETPTSETEAPSALPEPQLAPLPVLNWEDFEPAGRQQIRPIYDRAEQNPDDHEAVGRLGMILHAYRQFEPAEQCYQRARALAPEDFRWTYYRGIVSESLGKRPTAVALIRAATELSPDNAPAKVRLADLLLENGDLETSEALYREAVRLDPKLASAHYGLGRLWVARQDWTSAVESYQRACELEKNYAVAHYALGLAYRKLGQTEKARASLTRYQQLKDLPEPSFDPTEEAVGAMLGEAIATAGPSLELPKSGLETVAAELERALKEQPWLLSAHTNLIAIYWELGQPEKAEQHYRAAVKIDPSDAMIHYNWGLVQLLRGNLDAAAKAFQQALKINPQYADAHVQFGVLLERQRRADEALRHYRLALKSNPNHRRGHFHLGIALLRGGRSQEGIQHLHETIKVEDRQTPRFMRFLARAYADAGNRERALHYIGQARARAVSHGITELVAQLDSDRKLVGEIQEAR
jgi:tetratricopeptide (TPR) repeat protein